MCDGRTKYIKLLLHSPMTALLKLIGENWSRLYPVIFRKEPGIRRRRTDSVPRNLDKFRDVSLERLLRLTLNPVGLIRQQRALMEQT